jgi:hypothetical protein
MTGTATLSKGYTVTQWSRRTFLEYSTAALLAAYARESLAVQAVPRVEFTDGALQIQTSCYSFRYTYNTDAFSILDAQGKQIAAGRLQPIVQVTPFAKNVSPLSSNGQPAIPKASGNRVSFAYDKVNGHATLSFDLRFDERSFWWGPLRYESKKEEDVVSVYYFADIKDGLPKPGLRSTYITLPGICENATISPIQTQNIRLEQSLSLGHSGFYTAPYTHQQWGLPVHYFCANSTTTDAIDGGRRYTFTRYRSQTMVCGLADIPNGDLFFDLHDGKSTLWIDYRSDLWHHLRTPGSLTLGATFAFAFGEDQHDAISAYYAQLLNAGIIQPKQNSTAKNAVVMAPQFCTWGAQVERNMGKDKLTQSFLEDLYAEMKASGMKAGVFSIDDKWEGRYGNLEHDHERVPHFEEFLDRIRSEGYQVGLWTAFLRCENPADLGLEARHMLHRADGMPHRGGGDQYYILDLTHPEAEKVMTDRARAFVRRYKPAIVKFDFGYELPAIRDVAPFDRTLAGERLLKQGLDVIVTALRAENPDIVIMYYQLSPLFVQYFDLHSTDDLFLAAGDYDLEANRRIYFASPLTQLGVPVYGSSGYDWSSSPAIWFDSVVSGTIGSLNDFKSDEFGEGATPQAIAFYNGFAQTIRPGNLFTVLPFPPARPEAATRGARSRSWARIEDGKVTLVAQRPPSFDDGDMLDHRPTDPRVDKLITSTAPVVISSKTFDDITTSNHLAIVGCAEGIVTLKRSAGTRANITTHYLGGHTTRSSVSIAGGRLKLELRLAGITGIPVEWMEVNIS